MSATELREVLIKRIGQADERMLRVMYAMLSAYEVPTGGEVANIPVPKEWKEMTDEELKAELEQANDSIEKGEYISIQDLEKQMSEW